MSCQNAGIAHLITNHQQKQQPQQKQQHHHPRSQHHSRMADGDAPSRNFRSAYYEKLGFSGNEEKNILDLLIASSPFDPDKLNDLCERFDLDRQSVDAWKILLGVDCSRKHPFDEYDNVRRVRAEHYQSLKHHLEVLLRHNIVIKDRLKKCSKSEFPSDNHIKLQENGHDDGQLASANQKPDDQTSCQQISRSDDATTNNDDSHRHCKVNDAKNDRIISHTSSRWVGSFSDNVTQNNRTIAAAAATTTTTTSLSNFSLLQEIEVRNTDIDRDKTFKESNQSHLILKEHTSTNQSDSVVTSQKNPAKLITLMYLLEAGRLNSSDIESQFDSPDCRKLSAIASFFVNVSEGHQEAFFLFRNFTKKLEENEALTNKISSQKPK